MQTFLKQNLWAIIIVLAGFIGSYAVNSFRINALEVRVAQNAAAIEAMKSTSTDQLVKLTQIQTTVDYMAKQLEQINKKLFN